MPAKLLLLNSCWNTGKEEEDGLSELIIELIATIFVIPLLSWLSWLYLEKANNFILFFNFDNFRNTVFDQKPPFLTVLKAGREGGGDT